MKIGFAQINPTVGDLRGNCELIAGAYERLAAAGAELVLTPELAMTGYPPQDLVLKSRFVPENLELIATTGAANRFVTPRLCSNAASRFGKRTNHSCPLTMSSTRSDIFSRPSASSPFLFTEEESA